MNNVFENCGYLTSVTISNSVKNIGSNSETDMFHGVIKRGYESFMVMRFGNTGGGIIGTSPSNLKTFVRCVSNK